jgi:3-oxoadipate enol-lactonase
MQTASVNGVSMAFRDSGGGVPLLFVHGFPLDHSMWNAQIEAFSARNRAIAPDLRGFGRSEPGEGIETVERMADDLAAILDALSIGEPVVLCGLSMGGYIAFEFWRKYANRLKALIFCDTRASADKPDVAAGRLATAELAIREGTRPIAEAMLPKLFSPKTRAERPHLIEEIERTILRTDPKSVAAASRAMAQRRDFTAELKNIRCPTLVLVGADDVLSPPTEMKSLADGIPRAEFRKIADAGHLSPLERPAEVNAAIAAFLEINPW